MKNIIKNIIKNLHGWRTNRKIIVIESDDWGAIRTPSKQTNEYLLKLGYDIDKCNYMKFDSLASDDDISLLFELLTSIKNNNGISPKITANCLVANPNFTKIRASNFQQYHYEKIIDTFSRYPKHNNAYNLWLEGNNSGLFKMQSHGREHLNISRWMKYLQNNEEETHLFFNLMTYGLSKQVSKQKKSSYLSAFDGGIKELNYDRSEIIIDGLNIFEELFDYRSESFVAPNFIWDDEIERTLNENGVNYIQTQRGRSLSNDYGMKRTIKRHYLGQKNKFGQKYLVRNCRFEPSENPNIDWVDSCLFEIASAFLYKKPAIISAHRVNFVGYIDENNRDKNLILFKKLLSEIVKKWNDVEFLSSDELGKLIVNGK